MQPIGVGLLSTIIDKFEGTPDPELPGHLLVEQYQAQLVSAVRTALDSSSGPILLEAGLKLATKILTNGIIKSDQVAVKRIFSLISRPLNDFKDLYYPSFAEWVSIKIKIRLLAAHASLKCHTYAFLRRHQRAVPAEYLGLLPLFSKSSSILGNYWIGILRDYCYTCLSMHLQNTWNSFLDGIQSSLVSSKLRPALEESWPVILQAVALDAVPANFDGNRFAEMNAENETENSLLSGYNMVELQLEEYRFLWGFSLLVLFQGQHSTLSKENLLLASVKSNHDKELRMEDMNPSGFNYYEIVLPVFQFLSTKKFANMEFLTIDICRELLQIFSHSLHMDNSWDSLSVCVLSQILQNCPESYFETENFASLAMELCLAYLFKVSSAAISGDHQNMENLMSSLFITAKTLVKHFDPKKQLISVALAFLLIGYKCVEAASSDSCVSKIIDYFKCTSLLLKKSTSAADKCQVGDDGALHDMRTIIGACLNAISNLSSNCIKRINQLGNRSNLCTILQSKLAFSLEQAVLFAKLVYEMEFYEGNRVKDPKYSSIFRSCNECVRTILTNSNIQIQAIGLQMLKGMVQRGTNEEDYSFVMFLAVEFVPDIFEIIQTTLKKPSKESATVAGECLRFLVVLQTTAREGECQRGYMNLLLEAIIMVILTSEGGHSQELDDIRSTAIRVVSHLAQIPSSAVYFKDALLSMPVSHRQHLQGFIRASVTQDKHAVTIKSPSPSLGIQLPLPTGARKENHYLPAAPVMQSNKDIIVEDEEDEDDWDTFQSFPAAADADETNLKVEDSMEETAKVELSPASENNTRSDRLQEQYISEPSQNLKTKDDTGKEYGEVDVRSDGPSNIIPSQREMPHENIEVEESDSTHGSTEGNLVKDPEPSKENLDNKTETVKSDHKLLDLGAANKEHEEQLIETEKDGIELSDKEQNPRNTDAP